MGTKQYPIREDRIFMPQTSEPAKKRSWFRKLLRAAFVTTILTVSLVLAGWYWLVPTVLKMELRGFLKPYWEGKINIEKVDFSLTSPIVFHNLSARGPDGREWLRVRSVKLHLDNWPSLSPVLKVIDIENPAVIGFVDQGEMHLPFTWPEDSQDEPASTTQPEVAQDAEKKGFVDIQKIAIHDITLSIVDSNSPAHSKMTWQPALKKIKLIRLKGTASAEGDIDILLGKTKRIDAQFRARLDLTNVSVTDLREFLGLPKIKEELKPLIVSRIQLHTISFRDGLLTIPDYYIETCDGKIWGRARAMIRPNQPFRYQLDDLRALKINLRKFYASYDPSRHVEFGTAGMFVDIDGKGFQTRGIEVEGMLFMDNSDLDETLVIGEILDNLKVSGNDIQNGSDLKALFQIKENVLTFAQARLGNNILAIDMIPYGKINLETGMMDFVVVSAFLKDLRKIPILGILGGIGQGMSRLRIKGYWHEPKDKLIHKEPITDIAQSTENFFKDALGTGGQITDIFAHIVEPQPKPKPAN